jgi:hypothetical protein
MHPIILVARTVRLFQLMLGLKPLIQRIAAIHRAMFMVNLASPALYILQSGRVMIRMDLGILLEQHHKPIKTIHIMNFRKRIHKEPLPQAISFLLSNFACYTFDASVTSQVAVVAQKGGASSFPL